MEINPGGKLSTNQIIGRDDEIARFWQVIQRQGLILTGERRLGKSHVMWKMQEDGHENFVAVYQDLEGVHSTTEFVRSIYQAINDHLSRFQKYKSFAVQAWQILVPKKIKEIELPDADKIWKSLLLDAVGDVASSLQDQRLVFMWDEFPLLIDNIAKSEGAEKAIQILDVLRQIRQTHKSKIRFMFTGSIGLHLVLKSLRKAGHTNAAVNDMHSETLPPLKSADAINLGVELIRSIARESVDEREMATAIFERVGGFPYYIHHVADKLRIEKSVLTVNSVERIVNELVLADHDPANLQYYSDRIENYYDEKEADLAFLVLDVLCHELEGLGQVELLNRVRHSRPDVRDQSVREIVQLLRQDHYLTLHDGELPVLDFRWSLIKRWWRKTRS